MVLIRPGTLHVWRNEYFEKYPIPYIKIGRHVKYEIEDIYQYISEHKKHTVASQKKEGQQ